MQTDSRHVVAAVPLPAILIRWDERVEAANTEAKALLGEGLEGRHFITALRQPSLLDAIESTFRDAAPRLTRYLASDGRQPEAAVAAAPPPAPRMTLVGRGWNIILLGTGPERRAHAARRVSAPRARAARHARAWSARESQTVPVTVPVT